MVRSTIVGSSWAHNRFEVGDDPEGGEAGEVIGMDQLGVGDGRPAIPMPAVAVIVASMASRALRIPASPMAWMWI